MKDSSTLSLVIKASLDLSDQTWLWKSPFNQKEHCYQWGDGGPTTQLRDPMITEIVLE